VTFKPIGNRPAGTTPETAPLAVIAATAARAGFAPHFEPLSTDANVPMNLGIPAIAIGAGGDGGGAHAPSEWIDVAEDASVRGAAAAMATVLGPPTRCREARHAASPPRIPLHFAPFALGARASGQPEIRAEEGSPSSDRSL
jgi:hypothetical protein